MLLPRFLAIACTCALSPDLQAQLPAPGIEPLRDINQTPEPPGGGRPYGSAPLHFARLGSEVFFSAQNIDVGVELFASTGQPGSARLVADLNPGRESSDPRDLTPINGWLLFSATNTLWRTDGTTAGTGVLPGAFTRPRQLTAVNGRLYFLAGPLNSPSLWWSDGNSSQPVPPPMQGAIFSRNAGSGAAAIYAEYTVQSGTLGSFDRLLCRYDTVTASWSTIDRFTVSFAGNSLEFGRAVEDMGEVFYTKLDTSYIQSLGPQLWRSRVANPNPTQVVALAPPLFGSTTSFQWLIALGSNLFYGTFESQNSAVWRLDRTTGTITRLFDGFSLAVQHAGRAYIQRVLSQGSELWTVDGTQAPPTMLRQATPNPSLFLEPQDGVQDFLFWVDSAVPGMPGIRARRLWSTDGTLQGTGPAVPATQAAFEASWTRGLYRDPVSGAAWFAGDLVDDRPNNIGQPWIFEPGAPGSGSVRRVATIRPIPNIGSSPDGFAVLGGATLFHADDGINGRELWRTDGTTLGTRMVADVTPGPAGSALGAIHAIGDIALFQNGDELWRTDGQAAAGTTLIQRFTTLRIGDGNHAAIGRTLFFVADDGFVGNELWRTDGTLSGTRLVADLDPGTGGGSNGPSQLTRVGEQLFFVFRRPNGNTSLWNSDSSTAGTRLIRDFGALPTGSQPHSLVALGGKLVFLGPTPGTSGVALWTSDGTAGGTNPMGGITTTPEDIREPTLAGDRLFFAASDPTFGPEIWISDGTGPGTQRVTDFAVTTPGLTFPKNLTAFGRRLAFNVVVPRASSPRDEIWVTDGTLSGTRQWAEVSTGFSQSSSRIIGSSSGRLWFSVGNLRFSLWTSNGTTAGTRLVLESTSSAIHLTDGGAHMLIRGDVRERGEELWVFDAGASSRTVPGGCGDVLRMPAILLSDPTIGGTADIEGVDAPPNSNGTLLIGRLGQSLFALGCEWVVDLNGAFTVGNFPTGSGSWRQSFLVPNDIGLIGLELTMQGVFLSPASPRGFEATGGLAMRVDR